jgi:hypothetical protein
MEDMELNKDRAARHAKVLLQANEAYFYDYHWSAADHEKYTNALAFFDNIRDDLEKKAATAEA